MYPVLILSGRKSTTVLVLFEHRGTLSRSWPGGGSQGRGTLSWVPIGQDLGPETMGYPLPQPVKDQGPEIKGMPPPDLWVDRHLWKNNLPTSFRVWAVINELEVYYPIENLVTNKELLPTWKGSKWSLCIITLQFPKSKNNALSLEVSRVQI